MKILKAVLKNIWAAICAFFDYMFRDAIIDAKKEELKEKMDETDKKRRIALDATDEFNERYAKYKRKRAEKNSSSDVRKSSKRMRRGSKKAGESSKSGGRRKKSVGRTSSAAGAKNRRVKKGKKSSSKN